MRRIRSAVVVLALLFTGAAGASAEPSTAAAAAAFVAAAGRAVIVVSPEVNEDLDGHGVAVTTIGRRGSAVPFEDTVKITLPIKAADSGGVTLAGGIRLASAAAQLTVRDITIPTSGVVTGTVRGSDVGNIGRASLFLQASSDSELGDTSLRYTFTFASYVNASFDTDFRELGLFGYSTTRLR